MYSRVTLLEIDPVRIEIHAAVELFKEQVVPGLEGRPGYEGALVLATPEGKAMIVTLWTTAEDADAAAAFATGELERFMTFFKAPPGREYYEVVYLDSPAVASP
jgi:hypothetical protein